jgi:hypothetical protein
VWLNHLNQAVSQSGHTPNMCFLIYIVEHIWTHCSRLLGVIMKASFHLVHVGDRNIAMVHIPNVYGSGLVTLWENFVWTYIHLHNWKSFYYCHSVWVCTWLTRWVLRLDDWIYWHLIHSTWDYRQYSTITDLHTLQFTVTHTLGFSVFTSRILATGFITVSVTANYTWSLLFTA